PGEFARLADANAGRSVEQRAAGAAELCRRDASGKTIVVLKGCHTIVADVRRYAVNRTGNPSMATGGTGDCLTGVIAGLLAQGLSSWDAARLGTHVHGLAGDLAAEQLGQISLIASDLLSYLPAAFEQDAVG
ncbi:MAG TPA: ADP/ATP-dependent (S)-NAD(P)H-hydrate dehydratase, partial [Gemmataceae bacterium]